MKIKWLLVLPLLICCSGMKVTDYKDDKPTFNLREYFNGTIDGWAIFQNRSGKVVKRFHVVIIATWKDNIGTLDETFTYADGTKDKRIWTITDLGNGRYSGTADDVQGVASGQTSGSAFRWNYTLKLKVDDSTYKVFFDDWMWMVSDEIVINRSYMSKWGVNLGELTLSFRKPSAKPTKP